MHHAGLTCIDRPVFWWKKVFKNAAGNVNHPKVLYFYISRYEISQHRKGKKAPVVKSFEKPNIQRSSLEFLTIKHNLSM
jgi:hypothetical protein